ncbi:MAG: helix-turn-helix domain-containing protein [Deltaproteobacteria bacterium]|nr:helix-turn-helix domain-containing protein [Deltaproteobacteria bacterium]
MAKLCHHSRETVKRWLQQDKLKGYRIGKTGHWRILPKDLVAFLRKNRIPFPDPQETGVDLSVYDHTDETTAFCWEFYGTTIDTHVRPGLSCEQCLVYKTKALNCYALREEVGHQKINCTVPCEECDYFRFNRKRLLAA